jgi:hypothetical protein
MLIFTYVVWFNFEKGIRNLIKSEQFSQKYIQIHRIKFNFERFSFFFYRFIISFWIRLDVNTLANNKLISNIIMTHLIIMKANSSQIHRIHVKHT